MRWSRFVLLILFVLHRSAPEANPQSKIASGESVVRELNLARQHPAIYAGFLEELRENFRGNICIRSEGFRLHTSEGVEAIDDAIRFLRHARPITPLAFSTGLSRAAADHVAEQASGALGHTGAGHTSPANRISRYGSWNGSWGENIAYGESSPRDIVLALITDDGLRSRDHRKNIFNPDFNYAGAAIGPHARYGTVCRIDFAGGFAEDVPGFPSFATRN
jgi:hypothetical protein